MKKWVSILLVSLSLTGAAAATLAITTSTAPSQTVMAKKKKATKPSKIKTKKALKKYLKKTKNAGYLVKSVTKVKGVTTIKINTVADLTPVYFELFSDILGRANKTPMAKKGLSIVQVNKYVDASGTKSNKLEFSFFFAPDALKDISFTDWGHIVYKDPTAFYNTATGYYLMGTFMKEAKNARKYTPNSDLMKYDNQGMSVDYMDKYGA